MENSKPENKSNRQRIYFAMGYFLIGLIFILPFWDRIFYTKHIDNIYNVFRYIWCIACTLIGFSIFLFRTRHYPKYKSSLHLYFTYYPFILLLISTSVFSFGHSFEQTSGFVFYYLSFTLCIILCQLVEHFWRIIASFLKIAPYKFIQYTTPEIFHRTVALYDQATQLVLDFHFLWPGYDDKSTIREEYNQRVNDLRGSIMKNQIFLHDDIARHLYGILSGIAQYRTGRETRDLAALTKDMKTSQEGAKEMSAGVKIIGDSHFKLVKSLRIRFGLDISPDAVVASIEEMLQKVDSDDAT